MRFLPLLLALPLYAAPDEPVLVAKHAAAFIHGVPAWPAARDHVGALESRRGACCCTRRATRGR